jgi:uncharacterized integral membrane protein
MTRFLTSLILAFWVSAIALIAIQNATPVALQFLNLRTIEIPLGLVMAFSASIGMIGMAVAVNLSQSRRS